MGRPRRAPRSRRDQGDLKMYDPNWPHGHTYFGGACRFLATDIRGEDGVYGIAIAYKVNNGKEYLAIARPVDLIPVPAPSSRRYRFGGAEMTDWQPIETAPKDGTKIVIWNTLYSFCPIACWSCVGEGDDDNGYLYGWFLESETTPVPTCMGGFIGYNEDIEDGFMPTHWLHLPATGK